MVYLKTGNVYNNPVARLQSTYEQYAYTVELWQNDAGRKWVDNRMFSWQNAPSSTSMLHCSHIYQTKRKGATFRKSRRTISTVMERFGQNSQGWQQTWVGHPNHRETESLDTSNISGVLPIKQPAQPFPSLFLTLCHIFSTANVGATLMQSVGHGIRTDPIRDQRDHIK